MNKNILQKKLDDLDAALRQMLAELETHSGEALNRPPAPGKWSPLQVMHHLMRSEALSAQYVRKKLSFDPSLPKAGLRTAWRLFLLRLYLGAPLKWKAPPNVNEDTFPEKSDFKEVSATWLEQRRALREYLDALPAKWYDVEVYRHPFAGRLTLEGMLEFFAAHFRRHRRQIMKGLN